MAPDTTITPDPAIAERNLAALRKVAPDLAQQIGGLAVPVDSAPFAARTRDGQISFQLPQPDGSVAWFGRTSIPGVRAAALVDCFDAGKANVFLPGLAEGSEAKLLVQRLGRHRAVFVWEPEPHNVRMALELHDLAAAIEEKRLVLLVCPPPALGQTLEKWLAEHPGHLCPTQMMMYPWQPMAEVAGIRLAVEQAYQRTERNRQRALAEIRGRWPAARKPQPSPATNAPAPIAIISLHARDDVWTTSDALSDAAGRLGWPCTTVDIRSPADMHPLARAGRLAPAADEPPAVAILIDVLREQVADVLPPCIPAVCWMTHTVESLPPDGHDVIAVASRGLAKRASSKLKQAGRIIVCPPPCLIRPDPADLERDRPLDVVCITDTGPIDPAASVPKLPSYAQISKTASDLLAAHIETFTTDQAATILERAESKLDARIDEPETRMDVLRLLGEHLAPSMLWRFLAQILRENHIAFRIHGPGWHSVFPEHAGPALTTIRHKVEVLRRSKVAIHADCTGLLTRDALLAAGCGAVVLTRRHPTDTEPGGLHTLLKPDHEALAFSHARDLVSRVRQVLEDRPFRRNLAASAIQRCLRDHLPETRLKDLRTATTFVL